MLKTFVLIVSVWNAPEAQWYAYVEDSGLTGADCIAQAETLAHVTMDDGQRVELSELGPHAVVACEREN